MTPRLAPSPFAPLLAPLSALLAASALAGCSSPPPPAAPPPPPAKASKARPAPRTAGGSHGPGSSDGMTCEQARDENVDEVGFGKKGERDLSDDELGAVLNGGTFLGECDVPQSTHVELCTAVKAGQVVGVTVSMSPSSPDLEKCVASRVRGLAFPTHPKMDIVRTKF